MSAVALAVGFSSIHRTLAPGLGDGNRRSPHRP
jgi:hypothetical protein